MRTRIFLHFFGRGLGGAICALALIHNAWSGPLSPNHWQSCIQALTETQDEYIARLPIIELQISENTAAYWALVRLRNQYPADSINYRILHTQVAKIQQEVSGNEYHMRTALGAITNYMGLNNHVLAVIDPAGKGTYDALTLPGRRFVLNFPQNIFHQEPATVVVRFHQSAPAYYMTIDVNDEAHARDIIARLKHGLYRNAHSYFGPLPFSPSPILSMDEIRSYVNSIHQDYINVSLAAVSNNDGRTTQRLRFTFTKTGIGTNAPVRFIAKLIRRFGLTLVRP